MTTTYSRVRALATVIAVRRPRARRPALALALGVAGPVGPGVEVIWDAPASCPDAATARAEILARVADRPAARGIRAHARARALADGAWQVEVELQSDAGTATRTLRAASCEEALTATAVVVAIAVDPAGEDGASEGEASEGEASVPPPPVSGPSETSETSGPSEVSEVSERPRVSEAGDAERPAAREPEGVASRRELGVSISARGGLDLGALPSPAGHVAAAVGLYGRRFVVQAGALHRIRADASTTLPQPAGGRFWVTAAQLLAGPRLRWGALELPLAAGLELGAIGARGIGEVEPIPVRRAWAAALASVGLGWAIRPALAVQLGVDGVVPLLRPEFTLDEDVEVLTVGPIAARAWVGVGGRFSL